MATEAPATSLEIARLGAQGDGVADTPDGPVFVPLALPGERVLVEPHGKDHARLVDVQTPSAKRITPVCQHFGSCGGCVAQHMSPALYATWKRDAVAQAFAHRGLSPQIGELITIPAGTRRRASMMAEKQGGDIVLGFHAAGSNRLIPITECPVMAPALVAGFPALRQLAAVCLTQVKSVRLSVTVTTHGLDVGVSDLGVKLGSTECAELGGIASANGIVRLTSDRHMIVQSAAPLVTCGGAAIPLPPDVFMQATAEAEAAMAKLIVEAVGKAKRVADLFCGVGTFTFPLARRARVLAVDTDAKATEALAAAARHVQGAKPITTLVRDLLREPLSRKELEDFDAVVFDPPRAGAMAQAEMLAKSKVPVVVAVSCNPATLARDARILIDSGYTLEGVTPIDQFVWSAHVEAVAVFKRRKD